MSEIYSVTLPKSRYDSMEADLKKLREQVMHLEHLIKSQQYYVKTIANDRWVYKSETFYRPLEPSEIETSLTEKFEEERQKYVIELRKMYSISEQKTNKIAQLNDEKQNLQNEILELTKRSWWKLF